jgi:xylan 1,4-beta-xylosidase
MSEPRLIEVNADEIRGPADRMPLLCVGAGRANEGLRADWQEQLASVRKECGFRYIRMHALFHDDMGVYGTDREGRPRFNWQYIDRLYDFLLSIGMKPFVELSFTPAAMASGPETIFWWKGNVSVPKDLSLWGTLVRKFTEHVTERYGRDEVRSWYFECWNEPDLDGFFRGTQSDYFKLYEETARAVKSVEPDYRIGGPATSGCKWIPEFIGFCAQNSVPVDFISTHTYAVTHGALDEWGDSGTVFSPDPQSIAREVIATRRQIRESALPHLELHFTEWSSSYTPSDPFHDSYHSAAFILDRLKAIGSEADSMSYWVFTDIFEEAGPRFTPFHGGFGLLNMQGIPKAAFQAYRYLNRLGPRELSTSDACSRACRNDEGGLQVLLWDFTYTHPGTHIHNQSFYNKDLPAKEKGNVRVKISGMAPGRYALDIHRTGYRANDTYTAYLDLKSPDQLTRQQESKVRSAFTGQPSARRTVTVENGKDAVLELPLRENDVFLLEFRID